MTVFQYRTCYLYLSMETLLYVPLRKHCWGCGGDRAKVANALLGMTKGQLKNVEWMVLEFNPKTFISPPHGELHGIRWRHSCKPVGYMTQNILLDKLISVVLSDL